MNCSCVHSLLVKRSYPFSLSIHFPIFVGHCHQLPNMLIPYASQQLPHFSLCIHFLSFSIRFVPIISPKLLLMLLLPDLPAVFYLGNHSPLLIFFPHRASRMTPFPLFPSSSLHLSPYDCSSSPAVRVPRGSALKTSSIFPSTLTPWVISSKSRT